MSIHAKQYEKGHLPKGVMQEQSFPGLQYKLEEPPADLHLPSQCNRAGAEEYKPANKLHGKVAIITGGDSGIGRATALQFALEGAEVVIVHLPEEDKDALDVYNDMDKLTNGQRLPLLLDMDLREEGAAKRVVDETLKKFGRIDILINNAGYQYSRHNLVDISTDQWKRTMETNVDSMFYLTKAVVPHLQPGSSIVNCASVNPYIGKGDLVDYTATKGAIIAFTRALSNQLLGERGIRVNAVAPGPIWTPLIVATMSKEDKSKFGLGTPMGRCGQPAEVASCFVFLASNDSSYISGSTLHPNGGVPTNS